VFAPAFGTPLSRVSAAGGAAVPLTTLDAAHDEMNHTWPAFLPDGRHYAFQLFGRDNSGIYVGSLDSAERTRLIPQETFDLTAVAYAPGYLLFVRNATLMAQPFDAGRRELRGEPFRLATGFGVGGPGRPQFSVSRNGILAHRVVPDTGTNQPTWFDRAGRLLARVGTPGRYSTFDLSPDSRTLAVDRQDPSGRSIWLLDMARGTPTRFAGDPCAARPLWSPDGESIVFSAVRDTPPNLFLQRLGGGEERLLRLPIQAYASDWSPDRRLLVYHTLTFAGRGDIWALPVADKGEPQALLNTRFDEVDGQISPDALTSTREIA
jgi:WD40-like Beta Propeller Repeat